MSELRGAVPTTIGVEDCINFDKCGGSYYEFYKEEWGWQRDLCDKCREENITISQMLCDSKWRRRRRVRAERQQKRADTLPDACP